MAEVKKEAAAKKPAEKKTAVKKAAPAKKEAVKKADKTSTTVKAAKTVKKTTTARKTDNKKAVDKPVKKPGKIILEIDNQQIDFKAIEKKASKLGGNVYVVIAEKKIYDADGNSVDLF